MQWMKAHAVRRGIYCFVGVLIKAKKLCAVPPVPSQDYFFLIYSVVIDTFASPSATSDLVWQHKQAASQTVKHRFLYPPTPKPPPSNAMRCAIPVTTSSLVS